MRVLHIARRFAPMMGGIERYVYDVATGQARRGHDVTVLTLDRDLIGDTAGRLPRTELIEGVRVIRLPGLGNRRFGICLRPDRILAEVRRAEVIHHHDLRFMTGLVAVAARAYHRPMLVHTHGLFFHTTWASTLKALALRLYYAPVLRLGRARIIASSAPDGELLGTFAPDLRPRTVLFENAIVLAPMLSLQRAPEERLIVALGRLSRHKGLEDLLRAVALLPAPWRIEISGTEDRAERERLESIATELDIGDRVAFKGTYSDDEQRSLLGRAWVSVFPSHHEGFGLALLEAMAAGVPVVARDIPAHRAVLGPDLTDRLVTIDAPADLAAALERVDQLSATDREDLSARLRARAGQFDMERLLDQIEGLYSRDASG